MKQQQDGKFREAKQLYQEILDSEVMVEVCRDSGLHDGAVGEATIARDSTITRLKYLIYKNLASIAKEQGDYSAAVDAYIEVWIKGEEENKVTGRGEIRRETKREGWESDGEIEKRERVCVRE
jgi:hypothetical protein